MNSSDSSRQSPWQKSALHDLMVADNSFLTVVELVNSRGVITERRGSRVILLARELAQHPHIHALSITDNPGGNAVLSADILGTDLISRGQEVIIHLSCKDWNRNALQSHAWKLASEGFDNILAHSIFTLNGNRPLWCRRARPVRRWTTLGTNVSAVTLSR